MYSGIWLYDVQRQTGVNQGAHEGSLRQARNLFASLLPDCADT
jgi:hypothetical protein